jgi:hypothetical protein
MSIGMPKHRAVNPLVLTSMLVFSTLACRAATDLVLPPTATLFPTPAPATLTPTEMPVTVADAVCRNLMDDVLDTARYGGDNDGHGSFQGTDDEVAFLATYKVQGDQLGIPNMPSVPDELNDEQEDRASHQRIWDYFTALFPVEERWMVARFIVFTDGPENILGGVIQVDEPDLWTLEMDILDAADPHSLTYTLIHEFGHLLTLSATQVPPSEALFKNPDVEEFYEREAAACEQYFPGEGCSLPDSYLNVFFDRFWTDHYEEWLEIDIEQDEDLYEEKLMDFYHQYQDRFVTDYAPTSPTEDIAEAWTFFILSSKPEGDQVTDRKVLFFYDYPELVQLRDVVLGNLCEEFPHK